MNKCLDSATVKELEESTPMGRIGKAEDIAGAAMYLASKEASIGRKWARVCRLQNQVVWVV